MSNGNQKEAKNKPANTLFKQQRLASWQPIMSPPHVSACFVLVAAIFIPIGAAIYSANAKVVDVEARYDDKRRCTARDNDGIFTYTTEGNITTKMGCRTVLNFTIDTDMKPPIYMYYGLKNFYQNHRVFAKSRNEKQLAGGDVTAESDLTDTKPLMRPGESLLSSQFGTGRQMTVNGINTTYGGMVYDPAGLVPWSMFNDSFTLYKADSASGTNQIICRTNAFRKYDSSPTTPPTAASLPAGVSLFPYAGQNGTWQWPCRKQGIAWSSDREVKYKTPPLTNNFWTGNRLEYFVNATAPASPSVAWQTTYAPTSNDDYFRNGWYAGEAGHQVPINVDEDLMVWMRISALPDFRKLFRFITVPLPAGSYVMEIIEQYDVSSFNGEKWFALATTSWVGGKNDFLGQAYIAVGAVSFVAGVIFFLVHKILGDRTQRAIESLNELQ